MKHSIIKFDYLINMVFFLMITVFFSSLHASELILNKLRAEVPGLFSSFSGNFTYVASTGNINSGRIYYEFPGKLHLAKSNGEIIATNGRFLWIFDPKSMVCMKQDVGEIGNGIFSLLDSYRATVENNRYIFTQYA